MATPHARARCGSLGAAPKLSQKDTTVNTTLSTVVDHRTTTHPPSARLVDASVAWQRRVTLADRVALHVGLALITWSRRTHAVVRVSDRAVLRARYAHAADRARRERGSELALRQHVPQR